MQQKQIVVIDADELSRHGLQKMLCAIPGLDDPHLYTTIRDFEKTLNTKTVNIIFLNDQTMTTLAIGDVVSAWLACMCNVQIVIVSNNISVRYIQNLFAQGVSGFIHRQECTQATLISCMDMLMRRENYISPSVSAKIYKRTADSAKMNLQETDLDVLQLMHDGLSTKEIAHLLSVDQRSIHRSRRRLRTALGVRTNEQLLLAGVRHGLLELDV